MSWLRQPALHFAALGAALFVLDRRLPTTPPVPVREPIVVDAASLRADFSTRTGLAPTPADEAALVEEAIAREVLYREALARGLDRRDRSIRHRLVEKMRFVATEPEQDEDALYQEALALGLERDDAIVRRMLIEKMRLLIAAPLTAREPGDAELAAHLARHPERYRQPARVSLQHVHVSTQRRGGDAESDAAALLAALRSGRLSPEEASGQGDPFPLGARVGPASERQLARYLGPEAARAVLKLEASVWSGPVASPYGFHLVRVNAVEPSDTPPLAAVRGRLLEDVRAAERAERWRRALAVLRASYAIRVDS
jgi:hypothetical protein